MKLLLVTLESILWAFQSAIHMDGADSPEIRGVSRAINALLKTIEQAIKSL